MDDRTHLVMAREIATWKSRAEAGEAGLVRLDRIHSMATDCRYKGIYTEREVIDYILGIKEGE